MMKLIVDQVKQHQKQDIYNILNKILELEIKKEIQIPKFEDKLGYIF